MAAAAVQERLLAQHAAKHRFRFPSTCSRKVTVVKKVLTFLIVLKFSVLENAVFQGEGVHSPLLDGYGQPGAAMQW